MLHKQKKHLVGGFDIVNANKKQKYVILAHINKRYIEQYHPETMENIYPYFNNNIMILNKIGNNIINNIQTLNKTLSTKILEKNKTYSFNICDKNEDFFSFVYV